MDFLGQQCALGLLYSLITLLWLNDSEAFGNPKIRILNKTRGYRIGNVSRRITICGYREESFDNSQEQEIECKPEKSFCFAAVSIDEKNGTSTLAVISQGCWASKSIQACDEGVCIVRTPVPTSSGRILPEFCCCKGLYCNLNLSYVRRPVYKENDTNLGIVGNTGGEGAKTSDTIVLGVVSSVFAMALVLGIALVSWRCLSQRKALKVRNTNKPTDHGEDTFEGVVLDLNNITFTDLLHQGHYSTVRKACYEGCDIVMKSYPPHSHNHWQNERNIYYMVGSNPSIAKFLTSFEVKTESGPEGILVMDYYPNGSLLNFLKQNTISWDQMCQLALTVANGLAYLHGEIDEYSTNQTKRPVIVHRDLNSRNVLVKLDGTCVLADFGFAVHLIGKHGEPYPEVGTVRYMPPEMLGGAVNWHDESALKQADVYSLGLVLWEIAMRCSEPYCGDPVPDAKLPYEDEFSCHPTPDMIHQLVVHDFKRPVFPEQWKKSHIVYQFLKDSIEECWDQEPEARLTALCVVRRMQEIIQMRQHGHMKGKASSVNNRSAQDGKNISKDLLKNIVTNNVGRKACYRPLRSVSLTDAADAMEMEEREPQNSPPCQSDACVPSCCCSVSLPGLYTLTKEEKPVKAYLSDIVGNLKSDMYTNEYQRDRYLESPFGGDAELLSHSLPLDLHKYSRELFQEEKIPLKV